MSHRDRNGKHPVARQDTPGDDQPQRTPPSEGPASGKPRDESFAPWDVDPAEVDRYLAGRARTPSSRQPTRDRPKSEPRSAIPRLRRSAPEPENRSSGTRNVPAESEPVIREEHGTTESWDDAEFAWTDESGHEDQARAGGDETTTPPPRRTRQNTRQRTRARRPARPARPIPALRLPGFVARADLTNDSTALALLAVAAFGIAVMVAVMSNRLDALPNTVAIHLNAGGLPDRWGEPQVLWRLPLLATMITLINLTLAWAISPHDRFASRFLLAGAVVVQLLVWIAAVEFLW